MARKNRSRPRRIVRKTVLVAVLSSVTGVVLQRQRRLAAARVRFDQQFGAGGTPPPTLAD